MNIFGALKTPYESFYNYVYLLEKNFFSNFENFAIKTAVANNVVF